MTNFFSDNIKKLRIATEMTQEYLATKLNIKKSTVSSYESGRIKPSLDILISICELFKIDLNTLVFMNFAEDDYKNTLIKNQQGVVIFGHYNNIGGDVINDSHGNENKLELRKENASLRAELAQLQKELVAAQKKIIELLSHGV